MFERLTHLLRDLGRRLLPSSQPGIAPPLAWSMAALEAIVLCALAIAFSRWAAPTDPFGLQQEFAWLWLVPALLAMRYGTAIGVIAVSTYIAFWLLLPRLGLLIHPASSEFPKAFFLGGLVLVLICGQFSDLWTSRTRRLRAVNAYLDERLNTLTKNHFLLRLSHERLEQDLLAKPLTLRETLARLRALTAVQHGTFTSDVPVALPGAREFMQLLGQSCQLEIAALYGTVGEATGSPDAQSSATPDYDDVAVAVLGDAAPLDRNDALFRYCITEGKLAHVQTTEISPTERSASRYLICAPLMPSTGTAVGVLVVEKLPFFALNDDILQLLSVLIGYYADGVRLGQIADRILKAVPTCPSELALDLMRLHRIRIEAGIESSLVALVFANDDLSQDLFAQVKRLKRGVDLAWELAGANHSALITLLPLAGSAAVDGYVLRIESALQNQFGAGFLASHVTIHTARLGYGEPSDMLINLVRRCAL